MVTYKRGKDSEPIDFYPRHRKLPTLAWSIVFDLTSNPSVPLTAADALGSVRPHQRTRIVQGCDRCESSDTDGRPTSPERSDLRLVEIYCSHQHRICGVMTVPLTRYSCASQAWQTRLALGPRRCGRMRTCGRRRIGAAASSACEAFSARSCAVAAAEGRAGTAIAAAVSAQRPKMIRVQVTPETPKQAHGRPSRISRQRR